MPDNIELDDIIRFESNSDDSTDEDEEYERAYRCDNCTLEDTAIIKKGHLCPKDAECPECQCKSMNPVPLQEEE